MGKLGEEDFFALLELKRGDALAHAPKYRGRVRTCRQIGALARQMLAQESCFSLRQLAVKGEDLMARGVPAGPELGRLLNALLDAVLDGKVSNEKEALLRLSDKLRRPS